MAPEPAAAGEGLVVAGLQSPLAGPFSFAVAPGAILAVSGPSGAGKSLLLRMIADLDPNTGEVRLSGTARADLAAHAWRRRIPYVAAESGWWAPGVHAHFAPADLGRARTLAVRLGVGEAPFDGPVERLSTGERQRLSLIRALVLDPPALLLDEPTGALDTATTALVEAELLARARAGCAIVLVSHDPQQAARLGAARLRVENRRPVPAGADA
jgi:ABC-type iron transport system FetAB ATPase subunit